MNQLTRGKIVQFYTLHVYPNHRLMRSTAGQWGYKYYEPHVWLVVDVDLSSSLVLLFNVLANCPEEEMAIWDGNSLYDVSSWFGSGSSVESMESKQDENTLWSKIPLVHKFMTVQLVDSSSSSSSSSSFDLGNLCATNASHTWPSALRIVCASMRAHLVKTCTALPTAYELVYERLNPDVEEETMDLTKPH